MVRDPAHHWPRPSRGHSSCQPSHLERPRTRTADPAASRRCGHSGAQALALRRGGQQMPNALCALCADLARHPAAARHTKPGQPGTGRRVSHVRVSEPASSRAPEPVHARARARLHPAPRALTPRYVHARWPAAQIRSSTTGGSWRLQLPTRLRELGSAQGERPFPAHHVPLRQAPVWRSTSALKCMVRYLRTVHLSCSIGLAAGGAAPFRRRLPLPPPTLVPAAIAPPLLILAPSTDAPEFRVSRPRGRRLLRCRRGRASLSALA